MAGLALNGQDDDGFSFNQIEKCIGEASHDGPADTAVQNLVLCRTINNPRKLLLDRGHELMTETGKLRLVVVESLREIALGLTSKLCLRSHARRSIRSFTSAQGEADSGSRRYASRRRSIFSRSASESGKASGSSETLSHMA